MRVLLSRVLLALLAAVLVFGMCVSPAHAGWVVEDNYGEENVDGAITVPGGGRIGQSFTSSGGTVFNVMFYVSGYAADGGDMHVELYEHTGAYGTTGLPSGPPLAVSRYAVLPVMEGWVEFPMPPDIRLTSGSRYVAVLVFESDPAYSVFVGTDGSAPTHPGNLSVFDGASWVASADRDAIFSLNSITDTPVHRFYRASTGAHLFTIDPAEAARLSRLLADTYKYEGVCYFVNPLNTANSRELIRFFNKQQGTHLYTADPAERAYIEANLSAVYKIDGVAYYVSDSSGLAVHRFYNPTRGVHFYSTDPAEVDSVRRNLGRMWQYEGIAYYVGQ